MSFPTDSKGETGERVYAPEDSLPLPPSYIPLDEDRRRRCRRRGRHFFCFTALALIALCFFTSDHSTPLKEAVSTFVPKCGSYTSTSDSDHPGHPHHPIHYPIPSDVELQDCVTWTEASGTSSGYPHYASANVTLESASDLVFLSRGSLSFGSFEVTQSEDRSDDKVYLQLGVGYSGPHFLDITKVCVINRHGSTGLGIFTPEWKARRYPRRFPNPHFHVQVELPVSTEKGPLAVNSFAASLPLFKQAIADLGETIYFGKFDAASVNDPIDVESLTGTDVTVATVNSPIRGSFKANSSLKLSTVNGPITAEVVLEHDGNAGHVANSAFSTTTGPINVKANLTAAGEDADAKLSVYSTTVRGPINLDILESPLDGRATIEADSVTANIQVHTPPTFEGEFNLESATGKKSVNAPEVEDPSGRGRKRDVVIRKSGWTTVEGSVLWSEEGKKIGGTVLLKSTTGSLQLDL